MVGATVGFSIGFLSDALDDGPLGTAALIFMGVGYLAGLYRERGEQPDRLVTAGLCGAATIVSSLALGHLHDRARPRCLGQSGDTARGGHAGSLWFLTGLSFVCPDPQGPPARLDRRTKRAPQADRRFGRHGGFLNTNEIPARNPGNQAPPRHRPARGDHRRRRAVPVRGPFLPPLVAPGGHRRRVPGRSDREPHPRDPGPAAARPHPRPRRQRAGRQPHQHGAPARPDRGPGAGPGPPQALHVGRGPPRPQARMGPEPLPRRRSRTTRPAARSPWPTTSTTTSSSTSRSTRPNTRRSR